MKALIIKISLVAVILLAAVNVYALVDSRGTENTFDIATWNLKEFPRLDDRTVDTLAILIQDLQLDVIAVQEIMDTVAFADLLSQLDGWDGLYSTDGTSDYYQKTGLLYRTDQVSVLSWEPIFWTGYEWEFPRPPIRITLSVTLPSGTLDFYLIVLHLKAYDDDESRERRMAAMVLLKEYLDGIVPFLPNHNWMMVGDYNDELTDSEDENIFWDFLQDSTDYTFLTEELAGNVYWSSYPSYNSLIDHIMVTSSMMDIFGENGVIETLRLDDQYSRYLTVISDHRPVMAQFTDFSTGIEDDTPPLPDGFKITSYPNPFNATTNISFSLTSASQTKIDIYDCLGRRVTTLVDSYLNAGNYSIKFNASNLSSGVYFARLSTDDGVKVSKLNLIK